MKKKFMAALSSLVFFSVGIGTATAGKIIVDNDEWTLSDSGYSNASDTDKFVENIITWFDGSLNGGNILAYSSNFGLTGNSLKGTVESSGNTWTVSTGINFDLSTISQYNAIFLSGNAVDNQVLIDYVKNGGNVYLAGGTGWGGSQAEANQWNIFLNYFGLSFNGSSYNGISGNILINSTHSIFDGVGALYQNNGNSIFDNIPSDSKGQILISQNGNGLYAIYDSGTNAVPEPTTILLFGTGIAGLAGLARKKRT